MLEVVGKELQRKWQALGPGSCPVLGKLAGMIRLHLAPGIPVLPHGDCRRLVHPSKPQVGHHVRLPTEESVHAEAGCLLAIQFSRGRIGNHRVGHVTLALADSLLGQRDAVGESDEDSPEAHFSTGGDAIFWRNMRIMWEEEMEVVNSRTTNECVNVNNTDGRLL